MSSHRSTRWQWYGRGDLSTTPWLALAFVLFAASEIRAGSVTLDPKPSSSYVWTNAVDQSLSLDQASDRLYTPWSSASFTSSVSQGRSTAFASYRWENSDDLLSVHLDSSLGISAGGGGSLPGTQPPVFGAVDNGLIMFSVSQPELYSVTGSLSGSGQQGSPYTFTAMDSLFLVLDPNQQVPVYRDLAAETAPAFSYSLGTNPTLGTSTGILAPGNYAFYYEFHVEDFSGETTGANGAAAMTLRVGVPEPGAALLAVLGSTLVGIRLRRRASRRSRRGRPPRGVLRRDAEWNAIELVVGELRR